MQARDSIKETADFLVPTSACIENAWADTVRSRTEAGTFPVMLKKSSTQFSSLQMQKSHLWLFLI